MPIAIEVWENDQGFPVKARLKNNKCFSVISIIDLWHVYGEWWRRNADSINRVYYRLNIDDRVITMFKDLNSDEWFIQRD